MRGEGLSMVEQALIDHVRRGLWLDLAAGDEVVDEAAMRAWEDSRTCRAAVIRDILRGRLAPDSDPHGLRLRAARISGRLDLEHLATDVRLELSDCFLEDGLFGTDAQLAYLGLAGCRIELRAEPQGLAATGAVDLIGAHINGQFDCAGATLHHGSGPALAADRLQVGQSIVLGGLTATGSGEFGAVRLAGANIGSVLNCQGARLQNESGPALTADGLQVGLSMVISGKFTATGSGELGAVRLPGAHIGGQLNCQGARLQNESGPALTADGLQVGQDLFLGGLTATGSGRGGAVRLLGAHIGGQLNCQGARLQNESGPALAADGLQVDQGMVLTGKFAATGSGKLGAVRLTSAHIGDQLNCRGARLCNDSGPALNADGLQVSQDMFLTSGFTAIGSGGLGAVRLLGAHIGIFVCSEAQLRSDSGPALNADGLQVDQGMVLTGKFTATGSDGDDAVLNLRGGRIIGGLVFDPARLVHEANSRRLLEADGLAYPGVPRVGPAWDWLRLLRDGTPSYAAHPYQQLAAGYRALGDDRRARETLMAQRDDQLARVDTNCWDRAWGRITKLTLGYGYQPWRALLCLAAVLILSCVLAVTLGSHGALAQVASAAVRDRPCTVVQKVSVGLDLNLPVGTTLARAGCGLASNPASATATWLAATGWALRLLAWAFAALFIAGFTSAVRKT